MPRPRPPHLHRQLTRHGRVVWYVRIGKGPRTRLRNPYGGEAFWAEYHAAIAGEPLGGAPAKPGAGSLAWLWDRYRDSGAWDELNTSTRRQRENLMRRVLEQSGKAPFSSINRKSIAAGVLAREKTPVQARKFLDAMKGLFRWALRAEHVHQDPTAGVDPPKRKKTKGFPAWTLDDVDAYQAHWPIGTRQRVWLDVLLYTGLRRGDAVRIGKQHVRDGVARIRTEKSGEDVTVTLPVLPVLQATLDAGPIGDLAWICGERGGPLVKEAFGNEFSQAARAAGVRKSAHGVRKIAAQTAARNGATVHQLMAIFGWITIAQAEVYTREADRERMSSDAIGTLTR